MNRVVALDAVKACGQQCFLLVPVASLKKAKCNNNGHALSLNVEQRCDRSIRIFIIVIFLPALHRLALCVIAIRRALLKIISGTGWCWLLADRSIVAIDCVSPAG